MSAAAAPPPHLCFKIRLQRHARKAPAETDMQGRLLQRQTCREGSCRDMWEKTPAETCRGQGRGSCRDRLAGKAPAETCMEDSGNFQTSRSLNLGLLKNNNIFFGGTKILRDSRALESSRCSLGTHPILLHCF